MTELENIIAECRCPDELKPQLLAEAHAVLASHQQKGITKNSTDIANEALDILLEGSEPTVVLSIPDNELRRHVAERLHGEVRIISCDEPESLRKYIAQRASGRYNVIGVLGEADPERDLYPHRYQDLEQIIHGNIKPLISWVKIGGKSSITNPREGAERLPRAYSTVRSLITQLEGSLKGSADTPDVGTRVSPNWLALQLSKEPDDHTTRLRLAAQRIGERKYEEALQEYETVLRAQPNNLAALIGRSTVMLSQWPESAPLTAFKAYGNRGLPALLSDLREHAKHESDPMLDYLVGKAIVLTYIEKQFYGKGAEPTPEDASLDDAIRHLEKAFHQKRVNIDAGVSLALAHAFRGAKDDQEVSYELFLETLKFSDPLTEPRGRFIEFDTASKDTAGTHLLQLTGLHRAFGLGNGQFVLKRYERKPSVERQSWERPGEGKRAKIEQKNITYCHENEKRLHITSHGQDQVIETPPWSTLIESERGEYIFEIMPYLGGRNVGQIFERLIETAKSDSAKRKDVSALKVRHLEWITDACAALQTAATVNPDGTPREGLERVRDAQYSVGISRGRKVDVSWYTIRVFQKLVELFATGIPAEPLADETLSILRKKRIILPDTKRDRLVELIEPIAAKLRTAPDWLYVAYTDNNLRNYSVDLRSGQHPTEEAYVTNSRKKRYDLENAVVLLGTSDQLTAVEHELCEELMENDRIYLMNRWLGRIALTTRTPPPSGAKGHSQHQQLLDVMQNLDKYDGSKREKLSKILQKYLKKTDAGITLPDYQKLVRYDSLIRHLTIYCDKVREAYRVYDKVKDLGEQHGLMTWKPQFSWKEKARELRELGQHNTPQGQYALLRGVLEDLDRYHSYHRSRLEGRLNDLREDKLYAFLQNTYDIVTKSK